MSKIQKYVKTKYQNGSIIPENYEFLTPMDHTGGAPKFGFQNVQSSFQEMGGADKMGMGLGAVQDIMGAFQNPYDNLQGRSKEEVIAGQLKGGAQGAIMGGNPLNLLKTGTDILDTALSDDDAATYTAKEIGADVAGVGVGVGRILAGDVIGGGMQTVSELVDIGKSTFGRKGAQRQQEKEREEKREEYFAQHSGDATKRVAENVFSEAQQRGDAASSGLALMKEKYMNPQMSKGGLLKKAGTRPEHLKYEYLSKGGLIEKYQEGGMTTAEKARLGLDAAGIINPIAGFASGALDAKDAYKYAQEGEYKEMLKSGAMAGLSLIPFAGSGVKTLLKGSKAIKTLSGVEKASPTVKFLAKGKKATKIGLKGDKHQNVVTQETPITMLSKPVSEMPFMPGKAERGARISFNPEDYYSGGYMKYLKGGMTKGEFSHETNPLTVVDKNGQDTGMELTGGEGVFDKKAMSRLDKYKKNKNYSQAGKLVFKEMNSWKDAGTAKYGTRIKYK